MRRTVIALAVAASLGGCAAGTGGRPTIDPNVQAQIQQTAASICGFVPTISTVAGIVATFTGSGALIDLVGQVATSICDAVAPKKSMMRRAVRPAVNGVLVQGYFLR
jgi:hypothetical protein